MDTGIGELVTGKNQGELDKTFEKKRNELMNQMGRKSEALKMSKGSTFTVGHTVWIKGSKFEIESIDECGMRLKILPKD